MCIIHQLSTGLETFGDLSERVLKRITSNDTFHIFFVTNQYWKHPIKSCERKNRRANTGSIRVTVILHDQKLVQIVKNTNKDQPSSRYNYSFRATKHAKENVRLYIISSIVRTTASI